MEGGKVEGGTWYRRRKDRGMDVVWRKKKMIGRDLMWREKNEKIMSCGDEKRRRKERDVEEGKDEEMDDEGVGRNVDRGMMWKAEVRGGD